MGVYNITIIFYCCKIVYERKVVTNYKHSKKLQLDYKTNQMQLIRSKQAIKC